MVERAVRCRRGLGDQWSPGSPAPERCSWSGLRARRAQVGGRIVTAGRRVPLRWQPWETRNVSRYRLPTVTGVAGRAEGAVSSEKIARAYGVLLARGDKVTVRAVQREAGVRIADVAAWLREHATAAGGEVPAAPDLSEAISAMVSSVWAAAWTRAAEQADEATAVALDVARAGEAQALEAAELAAGEREEAVASRDQALGEVEGLRTELEHVRDQLETALQDASVARAKAEESDRARVRAEATSDTLREVLDSLRETARPPEARGDM